MARQNKSTLKPGSSTLRIIGGRWRGRKLLFPAVEGLRPTPDRVRETLFNWLQTTIGGTRCLDLFAGSGALGFEAASRGADKVILVEQNRQAVDQLRNHVQTLSAIQCSVVKQSAQQYLLGDPDPFDVVFIDPPYSADLWTECAQQLVQGGWLKKGTQIYLECPRRNTLPELPEQWDLVREKVAGDIKYYLFVNQADKNL